MAGRLTHGKKADPVNRIMPAQGRAFTLSGKTAALLGGWKLSIPDGIPYEATWQEGSAYKTVVSTPFRVVDGSTGQTRVGTTAYATLATALTHALSGDTIKVAGGTYVITAGGQAGDPGCLVNLATLTIEAEDLSNKPDIDCSVYYGSVGGSSCIRMGPSCTTLTVRGLKIKGYRGQQAQAGIYCLPGYPLEGSAGPVATLTVEYCKISNFENGILTNKNYNASAYLRYCVFENNSSTGLSHGVYFSKWKRVDAIGCTFRNTEQRDGHLMKCQAATINVKGCFFDWGGFNVQAYKASEVDFSNGGTVEFTGNVILASSNVPTVKYGASQTDPTYIDPGTGTLNFAFDGRTHSLKFAQNTIRKVQNYQAGSATEVLYVYPVVNEDGSPATVMQVDAYGSTIRNNIVGANNASDNNFLAIHPKNTICADTDISSAGAYAGGDVTGDPLVNDAAYAWADDLTAPTSRTDTYRGGLKYAATYLEQQAQGMVAGEWKTLSTIGNDASVMLYSGLQITSYNDKGAYDPYGKKARWIVKPPGSGSYPYLLLEYDEATNTWSRSIPSWTTYAETGHGYQSNTTDSSGNLYFNKYNSGQIYKLDRVTGLWSALPAFNWGAVQPSTPAIAYFPERNEIVVFGRSQMVAYSLTSGTWGTKVNNLYSGENSNIALYSPTYQCVYGGGGSTGAYASQNNVYRYSTSGGTPTLIATVPGSTNLGPNSSTVFIDPVSGKLCAIVDSTTLYEFQDGGTGSGSWETKAISSGGRVVTASRLTAIPTPYGAILILRNPVDGYGAFLYKHS